MTSRDDLHRLVDALPERSLEAAARALEAHLDGQPAGDTTPAPAFEASLPTPEEARELDRALAALARGEELSPEDVERLFGF